MSARPVPSASWDGSAVCLPGGTVLLSGEAVPMVLFLMRAYIATSGSRNGLGAGAPLSPTMRELRNACAAAVIIGHADVRNEVTAEESVSSVGTEDLIDIKEAAKMLRLSERHVRRLSGGEAFGPVRRKGRSILIRRFEVQAHANRKGTK